MHLVVASQSKLIDGEHHPRPIPNVVVPKHHTAPAEQRQPPLNVLLDVSVLMSGVDCTRSGRTRRHG